MISWSKKWMQLVHIGGMPEYFLVITNYHTVRRCLIVTLSNFFLFLFGYQSRVTLQCTHVLTLRGKQNLNRKQVLQPNNSEVICHANCSGVIFY